MHQDDASLNERDYLRRHRWSFRIGFTIDGGDHEGKMYEWETHKQRHGKNSTLECPCLVRASDAQAAMIVSEIVSRWNGLRRL